MTASRASWASTERRIHSQKVIISFSTRTGGPENRVEINNLLLLRPEVIEDLQAQLHDASTWRIMIIVDRRGKEGVWPPMD